ncbi:MAG: AAA family ATPase, partial [Hydrogenophaga sp.]|nr:AAA family ATPase [Hydrogenophaga sp.]
MAGVLIHDPAGHWRTPDQRPIFNTMLQSIHIQGFKGFKDTQIAPLRKVNLILGGQNVGKTSLLEAVYLGASPVGNVQGLPGVFRLAEGRDSQRFLEMTFKKNKGIVELGLDLDFVRENGIVKYLQEKEFFGLITGINNSINTFSDVIFVGSFSVDELLISKLIHTNIIEKPVDPTILLSQRYGLKTSSSFEDSLNTKFFKYPLAIPVNPPTQIEAVRLLDQVVLKRKKRTLLEALRRVEPRLEDIHSLSPDGEQRVYLELD